MNPTDANLIELSITYLKFPNLSDENIRRTLLNIYKIGYNEGCCNSYKEVRETLNQIP